MGYRVEVFDRNLKRVGEIDEWISLDLTVRLCQEGMWQLLIKDGTPQAALIEKGGGVVIWQDGVSRPLLSGQVDTYQKYWTKVQHTGPGSLYIAGKCHNALAYRRLAFLDPSRPVTQQYRSRLPTRAVIPNTPVATAIYDELRMALGADALPDRRITGVHLPLPDQAPQWGVADQFRMDVIGQKLEEWYAKKNTAYRFIYTSDTQTVDLDIFTPRDLSGSVRLSPELGNLREYVWTLSAPKVTRVIVGCAGEGLSRYYHQRIDHEAEAEWGLQIEQFLDRRDIGLRLDRATGAVVKAEESMTAADVTDAHNAVEEAAKGALEEGERNGNFQIYPLDTADCQFGRDYFVGDIVTVAVDGAEYSDVVREVVISVDDGGNAQDVSPKIGQQGSGEPLNLYKTVYDMQKKLRRLEARM